MNQPFFRKKPLEKISSPDKLDEAMKVTNPGLWSVLIACLALVVGGIVWFALGTVPETAEARGIIFPDDGAVTVVAETSGKIQDMRVATGDEVGLHDIVAVIAQPELIAEIRSMQAAGAEQTVVSEKWQLYEQGVIRSQAYGIVLDAKNQNDVVEKNEAIMSIARMEDETSKYRVLCYVPADMARQLEVGTEVQVSPSYASREEYGYMYGYVTGIDQFPSSEEDIDSEVGDIHHVENVLDEGGDNVKVRISLEVDPEVADAANSALWSNGAGNSLEIPVGTECDIVFILSEQRAYELALGA